ncbi:hypothetical protein G6O69_26405 [Pseudenhygromyxa sp. WMMC2535]|uniref:hypothetical protein n=1 Tax=Pseudenhygromyxa sp. WMMC2535 TaxID=2712867 RepID=UPI001552FE64|nr:hypothetical protein [Pseudenhygromyxa sp. WMMC2535]NVB41398.1 hypothetical protein [Pseudenhygromyxa sp. WMMC2535]
MTRVRANLGVHLGVWGVLITAAAGGCSDDIVVAEDSVGDPSTESESESGTQTETGSEGDTDTDTDTSSETGSQSCDAPAEELDFALVGALSPAEGCDDFSFTGQFIQGGAGLYYLDACPCDKQCLIPDPYTLTIELPDAAPYPQIPDCPQIHFRRDPDSCAPASLVIADLDDGERPLWLAAREDQAPEDMPALTVAPVDPTACPDKQQFALEFSADADSTVVSQGEAGSLSIEGETWSMYDYASMQTEDGPVFAWLGAR